MLFMKMHEFFWLVGLLEGEGSFISPPPSSPSKCMISIQMTDEDTIARVSSLFGNKKYYKTKKQFIHHKQAFVVVLTGASAYSLMKTMRPYMSSRRQDAIDKAMNCYNSNLRLVSKINRDEFVCIKKLLREQKLTHQEIANIFNIHRTVVSHINRGKEHKFVHSKRISEFDFEISRDFEWDININPKI